MVRDRGLSACPDVSTESDSSGSTLTRESALKGIGGVPDLHVRTGRMAAVHLFMKSGCRFSSLPITLQPIRP